MQRRHIIGFLPAGLAVSAAAPLGGCGFALRQAPSFAFATLYSPQISNSSAGIELKRSLESNGKVQVNANGVGPEKADVTLDVLLDQREKTVVGLNASGQVREFQLRIRFKFRLRNRQGKELIADTEILQQRDISFNESAVLAKEAEEALLYREMQSDIVQQIMRRLAAVKAI